RRPGSSQTRGAGSGDDGDDLLQIAHFIEDLDSILAAVAGIDESIITEDDAMRMATVTSGELTRTVAHAAPLAQVGSFAVEDHHSVIAVAVCNVDVTVSGIHGDVRRFVQKRLALICIRVAPRIATSVIVCRPVAHSFGADLQQ